MTERVRIEKVFCQNLQGLDFDEPLSARVVLQGPNGSGKTARLRAFQLALTGFPTKDGLAPFTQGPTCRVGVVATTGFGVFRTTRIESGEEPGTISVSNSHEVEPSMGEKTEAAVAERVKRELSPNVIALQLEALFALSGKERRRALLAALGGGSPIDARKALLHLDSKFCAVEAETGAPSNVVWANVKNAVFRSAKENGDALEFLALVEATAKAQASAARTEKTAAEGLARTSTPAAAPGSLEAVKSEQETLTKEIEGMVGAEAAAAPRRSERKRLEGDRKKILAELDEDFRATYPDEGIEKIVEKLEIEARRAVKTRGDAHQKKHELHSKAVATRDLAIKKLAKSEGRLSAFRSLYDKDAKDCPVCGTSPFSGERLAKIGEKESAKVEELKKEKAAAIVTVENRESDLSDAEAELEASREDLLAAETAKNRLPELRQIDLALAKLNEDADASVDPGMLAAKRVRWSELQEQTESIAKAQGERTARVEAGAKADVADRKRRDAEKIQLEAGPSGMQGEILAQRTEGLSVAMNEVWRRSGRKGVLSWRVLDARGNPDAELVLSDHGKGPRPISFSALSGGEQAFATGALVTALAGERPTDTTVLLLEAERLDPDRLEKLLQVLGPIQTLANVVVATPLPRAVFKGVAGWDTRLVA